MPEGRLVGQPFKVSKAQRKWLAELYDTPTRRFILSMGRKNGKTAFTAALVLLHLCGPEAKQNSQLYSAAQSRDQAAILFELAAKMVRLSPDLSQYVTIRDTAKELLCGELGTFYKALSADANTKFGLSPALVIHDELGQVRGPRSALYEALETASAAQEDPLSIIISTQAATDADLLSVLIDDGLTDKARKQGVKVVLHTAPDDADPFSDAAIKAANPHFDVFMNKDEVRNQANEAKRMPSREASYRNLILNQRINMANPFVSKSVWLANGGDVDMSAFENEVWIGLDLSARNDLTALVAIAKQGDTWHVMPHFFAPEVGVHDRSHRDRVPYDVWASGGHLTLTPGATVDYEWVAHRLVQMCDDWNVKGIAFDRWRIDVLKKELGDRELPLVEWGQGFKDMSPALEELESDLLNGRIAHGNNPVLTMCAANAIAVRNPAGDRKLDKSKPTGRIDGMQALAMARGLAARIETTDDSAAFADFLMNPIGR